MEPALKYARGVVAGRIVAGELVTKACDRFLADWSKLEDGKGLYRWDAEAADDFEGFTRAVCKVHDATEDVMIPFELMDWQRFFARQLFGWKMREGAADPLDREPGTRRFRKAWLSTGKGSGKGPLGASMVLYMMLRDRYAKDFKGAVCGSSEIQARELIDDLKTMVDHDESGRLRKRLSISGGVGSRTRCTSASSPAPRATGYLKTVGLHGAVERHSGPKYVNWIRGRRVPGVL